MHRFHLPPAKCRGPALVLTGREAGHAFRVLRVRSGDRVAVLDGAGTEFRCAVQRADPARVELSVLETLSGPALPCRVTLLQAVPRGKLIESIVQKATELGVGRVVPLLTGRVATRLDDEGAGAKLEKWRQVAIEAIKQCGSPWLPQIEPPVTPREFLRRNESFELSLVASLQPGGRHAGEPFRAFHRSHGRSPRTVGIWIGPEGDFTPEEEAAIRASGAVPITLGRLVLRVETAAVCCLAIINHELQAAPDGAN